MANENTARVHFIDGSEKIVPVKDVQHVGEEGARRATALVSGKEVPIYNRVEWGFLWEEQQLENWLDEEDEEVEGDGSGLHQCPYCYNLVSEEHEEFCSLNPNRNENFL